MSHDVRADVQAEQISGQVAVGNYILQIGSVHGGVVNVAAPGQQPGSRPRPTPVLLRPRPPSVLVNRKDEIKAANAGLQSGQPVEFCGPEGVGKTALLRFLAHPSSAAAFPDGIVYLSARRQSLTDMFQSLWDAFYESDIPLKSTDAQIRHALQNKRALILLDDVELDRDEVEALTNAAPSCFFCLASPKRRLFGEGSTVTLRGLPPKDALKLFERAMGRALTPEERRAAQSLCAALEGYPLRILQAAALVRDEHRPLAEVARQVQTGSPAEALTAQALAPLSESERRVLTALAVLSGSLTAVPPATPAASAASLNADHIAALAGLAHPAPVLKDLQRRGLIQAHSPRYTIASAASQSMQQAWDPTPWAEHVLSYLTAFAESQRQSPQRILDEAGAILQMLAWAVNTGRWNQVLRLGRAVEGALALGKRWGDWAQVLGWMLQAARSLHDQAVEAWALHQLGTHALCLGQAQEARASLSAALRIREAIGDLAAAAVTRHNLSLLITPPPPPQRPARPPSPPAPSPGVPFILKAFIAVVGVSLLALCGLIIVITLPWPTPEPPTVPPPPPPYDTPTRPPTMMPMPTEPPAPRPAPGADIWLSDGCDREYDRGLATQILFRANQRGWASVQLDGQYWLFENQLVEGNETYRRDWEIPTQPGQHTLTIYFDPGNQRFSAGTCRFSVRFPTPTSDSSPLELGDVWVEPWTVATVGPTPSPKSVCPEDKVVVRVRVTDSTGVSKVEIWARYPAGSGSWVSSEMKADSQTYWNLLQAHAEPGTELYIRAQDGHGNSATTKTQIYMAYSGTNPDLGKVCGGFLISPDTNRLGGNLDGFDPAEDKPSICLSRCISYGSLCQAYTYIKPGTQGPKARCWLKSSLQPAAYDSCCITGVKTGK